MAEGRLEVLLISAKGLENSDFLHNIDPYVLLTCRTQEQKSSVASGQGTEPEWNETFVFTISGEATDLSLKIMDKDNFSSDDFLGEAKIDLGPLFEEGSLPPTTYNVVKDGEYQGEIRVSLTFTPEERYERGFRQEESYGGWKQSSFE
ncbi:hypothetical protein MLD38_018449 [Melastoma candidum]|uniref:Uncharacterized protein n=1 Tax=Melastoma candidum TaxID=119954 RepID=A0ACB9QU19_9MYRT|nr:hypothetical protein MLD38_018449 [Melastoma candidum]